MVVRDYHVKVEAVVARTPEKNKQGRKYSKMTDQTIFTEITNWLSTHFATDLRTNWYVGIARNIEDRLFSGHRVNRATGKWIYRQAINAAHARSAEAMLLQHGHDGGPRGGDDSTLYVYAYRKELGTVR